MGNINILDKHVAELIAAGEVVERPSSVIKELVENSIDAGATSVTVEIKNGGVSFMRVTDNGCGILREDVPRAFLRHATSKVKIQDDLDAIMTLGFRGEALASIAAVSRVELLTKTREELAGTHSTVSGGEEGELTDAGCPTGTTFIIRDLFYNTPARMKFLKKDVSESNAVAGVMDRMALSHPEVSFRFIRDGKEELNTQGNGDLKSSVFSVYGRQFTESLLPIDYTLNGVRVAGYISKPTSSRPNRSMQHFFLNGRYVKSRTAMAALEEGYKGAIMVGKFPACVLHITLSCEAVDVNVHPAKIEVRFVNERPIFDAVYHGVKSALLNGERPDAMRFAGVKAPAASPPFLNETPQAARQISLTPEKKEPPVPRASMQSAAPATARPAPISPKSDEDEAEVFVPRATGYHTNPATTVRDSAPHSYFPVIPAMPQKPARETIVTAAPRKTETQERKEITIVESPAQSEPEPIKGEQSALEPSNQEKTPVRLVGEAFRTYILLERGNELVLIDKHAAHERLLYEKLKSESGKSEAQLLLEPVPVTLDKNEYAAVLNHLRLLDEAGFEIDDFGAGTVLVRSSPLSLEGVDIADTVMEMAGYLLMHKKDLNTEHLDWLYHNIACRAAIKAGAKSADEELIGLYERLEQNPEIKHCPHGRPVFVVLTKREIEKQFGRV